MADKNYFCIEAVEDTRIGFYFNNTRSYSIPELSLYYSKDDGVNWSKYTTEYSTRINYIDIIAGEKIYWKGNNTYFTYDNSRVIFKSLGYVKASGNVMSLVDETCNSKTIPYDNCFKGLFYYCQYLLTAPELPATSLKKNCYEDMFDNCTSLTMPPELPATTLVYGCYSGMFYKCTSLIKLPLLPATTLGDYCYEHMFTSCSKIKISKTKTGEYSTPYRIPSTGTISSEPSSWCYDMFAVTGGTFTDKPTINTTYYLAEPITKKEGVFSGTSKIGKVLFGSSEIVKIFNGPDLIYGNE